MPDTAATQPALSTSADGCARTTAEERQGRNVVRYSRNHPVGRRARNRPRRDGCEQCGGPRLKPAGRIRASAASPSPLRVPSSRGIPLRRTRGRDFVRYAPSQRRENHRAALVTWHDTAVVVERFAGEPFPKRSVGGARCRRRRSLRCRSRFTRPSAQIAFNALSTVAFLISKCHMRGLDRAAFACG